MRSLQDIEERKREGTWLHILHMNEVCIEAP
jgi:hypothetical protein